MGSRTSYSFEEVSSKNSYLFEGCKSVAAELAPCWNGVAAELATGLKDAKCGSRIGCLLKWYGSRTGY